MAELLRVEQAAAELSITRTRAYALLKSGELRSIKLGKARLIPRECIREFIERLLAQQSGGKDATQ